MTAAALFSPYFLPAVNREATVMLVCDESSHFYFCLDDEDADECAFERITSSESTDEIKCESVCRITEQQWNVLCKEWSMDCSEKRNQIDFTAFVPRNKISADNQCLNFEISRVVHGDQNHSLTCGQEQQFRDCTVVCNDLEIVDLMATEISAKEVSTHRQFNNETSGNICRLQSCPSFGFYL